MDIKNIAVIASRLRCVDAISVEAEKWIDKYSKLGYNVHLIAGKFGEPVHLPNLELPEIDYKHPEIRGVKSIVFGTKLDKQGKKAAEILLNNLVTRIKNPLKAYLAKNKIDMISVEDSLVSMKNLPLNMALSQIIKELNIPTISRCHYLPWDNAYFTKFDNFPKIIETIPVIERHVVHIANTESTKKKLNDLKKISSKVIPNTIDIDKLAKPDDYNKEFRKEFGIPDDVIIFLQPTRVKRNKAVERSVRIVSEINEVTKKDNVLIITGSPMYQRGNYFEAIIRRIKKLNVNVIFANDRIFLSRHQNKERRFYSIGDAYLHADFVLYPNDSDAFGNPVIEACAYRKPLIVNSYPNLKEITDRGFRFIVMDNKVTKETISDIYQLMLDRKKMDEMTENNFNLLRQHFSTEILDEVLIPILNSLERTPSFMTRITKRIFGPKQGKESHGRKDGKDLPKERKKESFKGEKRYGQVDRSKTLKNKKGGYKEPSPKDRKAP
ncbi:TPA: glycosyltransferase family 4 protein [Candidatus Woesearchaeota archaeon]|nr:glycosyltransferase family 4 protein [Candidatus Woesearchaeota archaeon]